LRQFFESLVDKKLQVVAKEDYQKATPLAGARRLSSPEKGPGEVAQFAGGRRGLKGEVNFGTGRPDLAQFCAGRTF